MPVGVSAYVPLATKTLTATQTSVTFSSISQAYRDLVLVVSASMTTGSGAIVRVRFNSDATSNYFYVNMYGPGTAFFGSSTSTDTSLIVGAGNGGYSTTTSPNTLNIMDYSTTNKHKTTLLRENSTSGTAAATIRWGSTSAITTISLLISFASST